VFSIDRPLLGWLFSITTSLLGESPISWQVFAFIARWIGSMATWWTLQVLWPSRRREATWAAILFALYPGFGQQPISVTYSHVLILQAIFIFSLGLMIQATRRSPRSWCQMLIALSGSAYTLFSVEYFFGLELLRPVFLWGALGERSRPTWPRIKKALLLWLPFGGVMAAFLIWRLGIHTTPRGQVQLFRLLEQAPALALLRLGRTALLDMFESGFVAWLRFFIILETGEFGWPQFFLPALAGLTISILAFLYLHRQESDIGTVDRDPGAKGWAGETAMLGSYALLIAGIPFWVTELPIGLNFPWDRFQLAMMLGASLMVSGILFFLAAWSPRLTAIRNLIFSLLLGLAIAAHLQNADRYRREWNQQVAFFWQLARRIPGLEPGTTLITAELPFVYFSDNSLSAPLNWMYSPHTPVDQLPFLLLDIDSRLGYNLAELVEDTPIQQSYRLTSFSGSTSQAVVLFYDPPRCLRVLNPQRDQLLPKKPRHIDQSMDLSDLTHILVSPGASARPPMQYYGPEPVGDWCQSFEAADLALQTQDWSYLVQLGDQVLMVPGDESTGTIPAYRTFIDTYASSADWSKLAELVPFIEGYARYGEMEKAAELTRAIYLATPKMGYYLCAAWSHIANTGTPALAQEPGVANLQAELECSIR